jgi:GNAT superfamily N-acetyltransferase
MTAYEISTDPARLDVDAIHAFLAQSYWSPGIPRATVARAIANSLCFGVFSQGQQVGFARVITDKTTFAYLCDVYVLEAHRGHGVSKLLMSHVMKHPDLQGLRRMMLATRDAHGLYSQYGFTALGAPDRIMEVLKPDIYSTG